MTTFSDIPRFFYDGMMHYGWFVHSIPACTRLCHLRRCGIYIASSIQQPRQTYVILLGFSYLVRSEDRHVLTVSGHELKYFNQVLVSKTTNSISGSFLWLP